MKFTISFSLLIAAAATASAQIIPIDFDSGDTASFDGWANLSSGGYPGPGYGSFPGAGAWPGPIGSNVAGSGDANLVKVANGPGGGPFVASNSIYFGSFTAVPNTLGGTLGVTDGTMLAGTNTIVLQVQIGEASGYDFFNEVPPALVLNGTTPITLEYSALINQFQDGTFVNPVTGLPEPVYVNTWGFQWDVSTFGGPITSLSIEFSGVTHSQVYALQLDQSTGVYNTSLVPEPSVALLLGSAGAAILLVRRRRLSPATVPSCQ